LSYYFCLNRSDSVIHKGNKQDNAREGIAPTGKEVTEKIMWIFYYHSLESSMGSNVQMQLNVSRFSKKPSLRSPIKECGQQKNQSFCIQVILWGQREAIRSTGLH